MVFLAMFHIFSNFPAALSSGTVQFDIDTRGEECQGTQSKKIHQPDIPQDDDKGKL